MASGYPITSDLNNDGTPDRIYVGSITYNARGDVLHRTLAGDFNADGVTDFTSTTRYNY